jgi:hypothetical protein
MRLMIQTIFIRAGFGWSTVCTIRKVSAIASHVVPRPAVMVHGAYYPQDERPFKLISSAPSRASRLSNLSGLWQLRGGKYLVVHFSNNVAHVAVAEVGIALDHLQRAVPKYRSDLAGAGAVHREI